MQKEEVIERFTALVGKHLEIGPGIVSETGRGLARLSDYRYAEGMRMHSLTLYGLWLSESGDVDGMGMHVGMRRVYWTPEQARARLPILEDRVLTEDSYRAMVEPVLDLLIRFQGGLM